MILLGFVWCVMGAGVELGASQPHPELLFMHIPADVRAGVWLVTGLAAIITAIMSSRTDAALSALVVMPLLRLVSYVWGWVTWLTTAPDSWLDRLCERLGWDVVPDPPPGLAPIPRGLADGWFNGAFYLVMVAFVVFAAHIPPGLLRARPSPDASRCPHATPEAEKE